MNKKTQKFLESKKGKIITIAAFGVIGGGIGISTIFTDALLPVFLNPIAVILAMFININSEPLYLVFSVITYALFGFLITTKRKILYVSLFLAASLIAGLFVFHVIAGISGG